VERDANEVCAPLLESSVNVVDEEDGRIVYGGKVKQGNNHSLIIFASIGLHGRFYILMQDLAYEMGVLYPRQRKVRLPIGLEINMAMFDHFFWELKKDQLFFMTHNYKDIDCAGVVDPGSNKLRLFNSQIGREANI
jgi:hypothetical protein